MNSNAEFVLKAIEDTQATIRAVDVKIAALLVGVLAPLSATGRIFSHLETFAAQYPKLLHLFVASVFLLAWFLALYCMVKAIGAIDNPVIHIPNTKRHKGVFFGGGLFRLKMIDSLINRREIMATKGFDAFLEDIPVADAEILSELVFEQMKLIYIRDMKFVRLNWAMRFATIWVSLGVVIYLSSRYVALQN